MEDFNRHNQEIHQNLQYWQRKKILREIYSGFYREILKQVDKSLPGKIVEIGSGIGNLKMVLPECICTDVFANSWIDQVENAYRLSFADRSVSHLILFDVWHHLQYPRQVMEEFKRVLVPGGRVIIFEPCIGLMGAAVYGWFHKEPVAWFDRIERGYREDIENFGYYAAQGNATRIFGSSEYKDIYAGFSMMYKRKYSALAYVLSGGYSGRQFYPDCFYKGLKGMEKWLDRMPWLFATRMLVVLKKGDNE
ncbi:MAG: class I SAM-dependent methyltransferase [Odoribacter sp.]|nr:class I SAM-dependent methyltransferase [Odoribacter sp.]